MDIKKFQRICLVISVLLILTAVISLMGLGIIGAMSA